MPQPNISAIYDQKANCWIVLPIHVTALVQLSCRRLPSMSYKGF